MPYCWLVDHDYTEGSGWKPVEVIGPAACKLSPDQIRAEGVPFRMRDDDGEIYYTGIFAGDPNSQDAFGPLDDYGMPNAGCTSIEYRNAAGKWETL